MLFCGKTQVFQIKCNLYSIFEARRGSSLFFPDQISGFLLGMGHGSHRLSSAAWDVTRVHRISCMCTSHGGGGGANSAAPLQPTQKTLSLSTMIINSSANLNIINNFHYLLPKTLFKMNVSAWKDQSSPRSRPSLRFDLLITDSLQQFPGLSAPLSAFVLKHVALLGLPD